MSFESTVKENNRKKQERGEDLVVPQSMDGLFISTTQSNEFDLSNSEPTSGQNSFTQISAVLPKLYSESSSPAPTAQDVYARQAEASEQLTQVVEEAEVERVQPRPSAAKIEPAKSKISLKTPMEISLGFAVLGVFLMGLGGGTGCVPLVIAGAVLTGISFSIYLALSLYHLSQSKEGITACGFFSLLKDNAVGFFNSSTALLRHNPGPALSSIRCYGC